MAKGLAVPTSGIRAAATSTTLIGEGPLTPFCAVARSRSQWRLRGRSRSSGSGKRMTFFGWRGALKVGREGHRME